MTTADGLMQAGPAEKAATMKDDSASAGQGGEAARAGRRFTLGVLLATLLIPGAMILGRPFDEIDATLGVLLGWGLAFVLIVPSYVLLSRAALDDDHQRFIRVFMVSVMVRFAASIVGVVAYWMFIDRTPWTFVLTFFLGYATLSTIEVLLIRTKPDSSDRTHA